MMLDSNILIGYLNGDATIIRTISDWKISGRSLFTSSICVAEILAFPAITPADIRTIRAFLKTFVSIAFDDIHAETAALFRRSYKLEIPDAAIAATAYHLDVPLVTQDNIFRKVREISLLKI